MKKNISIILGIFFSVIFLFFALKNVDFAALAATYSKINPFSLLLLASIFVSELFIRGLRWKLLFVPGKSIRVADTFRLETIGLALNNVLPLRLGEVARATLGASVLGIPMLTCISTILVERALDMFSLIILFIAATNFGVIKLPAAYGGLSWLVLVFLVAALFLLVFLDELLVKSEAFSSALRKFPRLDRVVRQVAMGAEALRDWKRAVLILALGFSLWMVDALLYYAAGLAVSLSPHLGYWHALILLCLTAAAVIIPAVPGYFGTYEYAIMKVLAEWGVAESAGFAYAGFLHVTGYVLVTGMGVVFLYQAGHSLSGVWKSLRDKR